jgi:hypothetical protein
MCVFFCQLLHEWFLVPEQKRGTIYFRFACVCWCMCVCVRPFLVLFIFYCVFLFFKRGTLFMCVQNLTAEI